MADSPQGENKKNLNISLDFRLISLILLAVIAAMLLLWKPWQEQPGANDRTVQVTGDAKISAEPDEFVFYPTYSFKNSDQSAALAELNKKSDEIVSELNKLGVADNKIKTNSDGYERGLYMPDKTDGSTTYTLTLTVTVDDKELAQKVQNYIVSTNPMGAVSPQASFSEKKRKELENQARDTASKDARRKAEQSAKNLGYDLGRVKSVSDGSGFGPIQPLMSRGAAADSSAASELSLQPGENDLNYSVTVTYYIK